METLGSGRLSHGLVLCCAFWGLCLASPDYDDYSQNSTDEQVTTPEITPCPRAIPGEKATINNVTYLLIHEATRSQLGSVVTVRLIPCLYTLVFLVGLPSNGLALWVLATRAEKLTSTVFLMNLAAADLLLISVLPFKIFYYFLGNNWLFGEGLCRLTTAFFYGNMYCSVLLLSCISVDRYLAVVHPFFSRSFRTPAFAACTCTAIWLCAAVLTLPLTLQQQSYPLYGADATLCHDVLPRHEDDSYNSKLYGNLYISYMVSLAISTFNSCADPFVYYYVSEDFRDKVRRRFYSHRKQNTTSLKTSKETLPQKDSKDSLV
ncbi:proteinase-activated receptor 4 isoform X2 [Opisthocomus hoazin]|uniref:proteinase-activated receptor 4 isoform X2 n=1 Tax=Opisthocomus hoazin TaxID=30419 RepID=UPI003F53760C